MESSFDKLHEEAVSIFSKLESGKYLCMSPKEAAEIFLEPIKNEVAFESADQFIYHQLTILDAFAQERPGYIGISRSKLIDFLHPLILQTGIFSEN